jgi:hypothetical protein
LRDAPVDEAGRGEVALDLGGLEEGEYDIIAVLRDRYGNETRQVVREHVRQNAIAQKEAFERVDAVLSPSKITFRWKIRASQAGNVSVVTCDNDSQYLAAGYFSQVNQDHSWMIPNSIELGAVKGFRLVFDGVSGRIQSNCFQTDQI